MKEHVSEKVIIQSIGENLKGGTVLNETSFSGFLKSIASIPKDISFSQELLDYQISIDGNMANVWTPYTFYFAGRLNHCGVNSFWLVKINGK